MMGIFVFPRSTLLLTILVAPLPLVRSANKNKGRSATFSFTDKSLPDAVDEWLENREKAELAYGPIGEWDTSQVTNLNSLFQNQDYFDEDISQWDVSKVTSMRYTFAACTYFNSPLNNW